MKAYPILSGFIVVLLPLAGCDAEGGARFSRESERAAREEIGAAQEALNGFYINTINGRGTGCPTPLTYTVTPDGQTFTVYFADMRLQHPTGPTFQKINCAVGLNLHLPSGMQFSVATINTRGYAHLPTGTYGQQRSTYSFAGGPVDIRAHNKLVGVYDDDYTFTDGYYGVGSALTSPCGGDAILNIDTALILDTSGNPTADAYIDNTTVDGTFRMVFQLGWDHC
jgi:hypothetical protein